ncbi:hypothetical protein jhhlp_006057 [Lomentospora prolificans]|uniref:O-acyltransferase n=1 Tax=Lomentospora prolificans TaxID=41688 RepID=A0A2N3N4U2_9PEZI|nr:hypothetical protein jhhlp_006057 [Lomentospora prolificans]
MDTSSDDKTMSRSSSGHTPDSENQGVLYIQAEGDSPGADHPSSVSISYTDSSNQPVVRRATVGKKFGLKARGKFRDLVFTRNFSAFDPQNEAAANSPFYGFYTLFWLAVSLFILKTAAKNWRMYGNPLGTNEIMRSMFSRDVFALLFFDGFMCALTIVTWLLQKLVFLDYLDWNTSGWILQNLWQTLFIGGFVGLTIARDWPWSHTVFFVLHGLVLLMKQHSYAFYNGHLSTAYKLRKLVQSTLAELERNIACGNSWSTYSTAFSAAPNGQPNNSTTRVANSRHSFVSDNSLAEETPIDEIIAAINSHEPLSPTKAAVYKIALEDEISQLTKELVRNTTVPKRDYPNNLTLSNLCEYLVFPTVVYELEYPRSESIRWRYLMVKSAALVGVLFVMNMVSQTFIYPVVVKAIAMKDEGMPLNQRLQEFPWMLSDLIFPFMMEYLLTWYLIWETILNVLAELTRFADRSFYDAWWNSVSWDQFARDWNKPVHNFLLRHVYHSSISFMKVDKHTATLITFFLSACIHEMIMWCLFKKLRGYLLVLQMCQLPSYEVAKESKNSWKYLFLVWSLHWAEPPL